MDESEARTARAQQQSTLWFALWPQQHQSRQQAEAESADLKCQLAQVTTLIRANESDSEQQLALLQQQLNSTQEQLQQQKLPPHSYLQLKLLLCAVQLLLQQGQLLL